MSKIVRAALVSALVGATLAFPAAAASPAPSPGSSRVEVTGAGHCDYTVFDLHSPVLSCRNDATDPRVTGTATRAFQGGNDSSPLTTWSWETTLKGPDGTWSGRGVGVGVTDYTVSGVEVMTGSGAYTGLVYSTRWTLGAGDQASTTGVIYSGPPPSGFAPTLSSALVPTTIGEPADDGARITAIDRLDARALDLTIDSPALGSPPRSVSARLLLPADFESRPDATWPLLYVLHGAQDDETSWTRNTDLEALTAADPMLVVLPAASFQHEPAGITDGWYTDWYNGGTAGPPAWETFHLTELRQLLERNFRAGGPMAVAGLSMGGYGAVNYASRHPDLFKAAASFSGVLDLKVHADDFTGSDSIARLGDPVTNAAFWDAHDPLKFVATLKGMPLYISYGNGQPGPLDHPDTQIDDLEQWIGEGSDQFVSAMNRAGVKATVDAYGSGTHSWPYWERGLHEAMPMLRQALGLPE